MSSSKQDGASCPLCGGNATVDGIDAREWRRYSCATCKQFSIAPRAEDRLRTGAADNGDELGACARAAPAGRRCVVEVEQRQGGGRRVTCRYEREG